MGWGDWSQGLQGGGHCAPGTAGWGALCPRDCRVGGTVPQGLQGGGHCAPGLQAATEPHRQGGSGESGGWGVGESVPMHPM